MLQTSPVVDYFQARQQLQLLFPCKVSFQVSFKLTLFTKLKYLAVSVG